MDVEQPAARNSVTVESPYGLRCFALRLGDVTVAPDQVLVVPTHAMADASPDGQVLNAAARRFGANFARLEPLIVTSGTVGTYRVVDKGSFEGREVLLVRIPGRYSVELEGGVPMDVLGQALWTLFGSLSALELRQRGLTSLALPLLAGTRGYSTRDLLSVIMHHSLGWLRVSREMSAVNLYLIDQRAVTEWADVMDGVLGRRSVDAAQNTLLRAFRAEALALLSSGSVGSMPRDWKPVLDGLQASLQLPNIPVERIAMDARRLVEFIVAELVRRLPNRPVKHTLAEGISYLRNDSQIAPWIVSHFDSLRHFGNAAAHTPGQVSYQPSSLREEDLLPLLASLHRVIEFAARIDEG